MNVRLELTTVIPAMAGASTLQGVSDVPATLATDWWGQDVLVSKNLARNS